MNDRPIKPVPPGPLSRDVAADIARAQEQVARMDNLTASPPLMLSDTAAGPLLTADFEQQINVQVLPTAVDDARYRDSLAWIAGHDRRRQARRSNRPLFITERPEVRRTYTRPQTLRVDARRSLESNGTTIDPGTAFIVPFFPALPTAFDADDNDSGNFLPVRPAPGNLAVAMDAVQTTAEIDSGYTGFPTFNGFNIRVGNEGMSVTGGAGTPTFTVTRGSNPQAHSLGSPIYYLNSPSETFTVRKAGTYLVMLDARWNFDLGESVPYDPTTKYIGLEMRVNVGAWEEIGQQWRAAFDVSTDGGFGWAVKTFAAGDTVQFRLNNRFSTTIIKFVSAAQDPVLCSFEPINV